jgi:carboxylesterase type B
MAGFQLLSLHRRSPHLPTNRQYQERDLLGLSLSTFGQDTFYGIPFAQPPLGNLRLRYPEPFNQSWIGQRNATMRGFSCPSFSAPELQGFADGLNMSEDCLTLDIIRPAGVQSGDDLPIFLWFYGGGFKVGGSADPRYNASFMVRNSVEMNKPTMVVIPNYRTMSFGVMGSREILEAGNTRMPIYTYRFNQRPWNNGGRRRDY